MLRDESGDGTYYTYDTYMGLTDYNHLRELLGYEKVELGQSQYLVQIKPRLERPAGSSSSSFSCSPKGACPSRSATNSA